MPICLLNVCFKIFTKVATIRLSSVADHVLKFSQKLLLLDLVRWLIMWCVPLLSCKVDTS
jgi:hypothetical protein